MKKIIIASILGLVTLNACQQNTKDQNDNIHVLTQQAMDIHNEIMPQISHFDRATIKIDSVLANLNTIAQKEKAIDTVEVKKELTSLKQNLEDATDKMMTWMKEYSEDSTDVAYQSNEIEKVKELKKTFEEVSLKSNTVLGKF